MDTLARSLMKKFKVHAQGFPGNQETPPILSGHHHNLFYSNSLQGFHATKPKKNAGTSNEKLIFNWADRTIKQTHSGPCWVI